jgi:hypothetical protein
LLLQQSSALLVWVLFVFLLIENAILVHRCRCCYYHYWVIAVQPGDSSNIYQGPFLPYLLAYHDRGRHWSHQELLKFFEIYMTINNIDGIVPRVFSLALIAVILHQK